MPDAARESLTLLTEVLSDAYPPKRHGFYPAGTWSDGRQPPKIKKLSKAADCYYRYMELSPTKQLRSNTGHTLMPCGGQADTRNCRQAYPRFRKIKYGIDAEIPFEISIWRP